MKTELPDDIDLLKGMLAQHQAMLKQQQAQMKQQQTQLRTYAGQVAGYERETSTRFSAASACCNWRSITVFPQLTTPQMAIRRPSSTDACTSFINC